MVTARWYVHHCKKGIVIWISVDSHLEYKTHYSIPFTIQAFDLLTYVCITIITCTHSRILHQKYQTTCL